MISILLVKLGENTGIKRSVLVLNGAENNLARKNNLEHIYLTDARLKKNEPIEEIPAHL